MKLNQLRDNMGGMGTHHSASRIRRIGAPCQQEGRKNVRSGCLSVAEIECKYIHGMCLWEWERDSPCVCPSSFGYEGMARESEAGRKAKVSRCLYGYKLLLIIMETEPLIPCFMRFCFGFPRHRLLQLWIEDNTGFSGYAHSLTNSACATPLEQVLEWIGVIIVISRSSSLVPMLWVWWWWRKWLPAWMSGV